MLNTNILDRAAVVIEVFKQKNLKLATVESCTGGLITAYLTLSLTIHQYICIYFDAIFFQLSQWYFRTIHMNNNKQGDNYE